VTDFERLDCVVSTDLRVHASISTWFAVDMHIGQHRKPRRITYRSTPDLPAYASERS
jgi:hypothetical protein